MDIVTIPCPHCGHQLQLRDRSLLGHAARCPKCNQKFLLEEPNETQRPDMTLSGRETIAPRELAESLTKPEQSGEPVLQEFGRYQLLRQLGQGAMGTVYLARDTQLDRQVALKIPKFGDNNDSELLERFYREARSAATLRHPNICPVYDVGEVDGSHYLTMAYIEGRTLSSDISSNSRIPERQVVGTLRKLASALEHAHQKGIVHRDLKPGNIMTDKRNDPIVMDFGLALQLETRNERLTQTGTILGTPAYMAPEQVRAEWDKVGPHSDIYSLGVILYELLTGNIPFDGPVGVVMAQVLTEEPQPPSKFRSNLSPNLESICLRMMAKEIDDRYASMSDVNAALAEFLKKPPQGSAKQPRGLPTDAELTTTRDDIAATSSNSDKVCEPPAATVGARRTSRSAKERVVSPTEQRRRAEALFRTAQQCMETYDYEQAIELLQQIPEANLSGDARDLLEDARERQDEVVFLMAAIGKTAGQQRHTDLRTHLKRLLELKPGHRRARQAYKRLTSKTTGGGNQAARYWLGGIPEQPVEQLHEDAYWRKWIIAGSAVFLVTSAVMWIVVKMYVNSDGEPQSESDILAETEGHSQLGTTGPTPGASPSNERVTAAADDIDSRASTGQRESTKPTIGNSGSDQENATTIESVHNPILTVTGHTGNVSAVAWSPDGLRIASAGWYDSTVNIWDAKSGRKLLSLQGHSKSVLAVAFSPNGRRIVSGGGVFGKAEGELKVWDAETGQELLTLSGHSGHIQTVAFSPDGRRIASGSWDGIVKVWDVETGRETLTFTGHKFTVKSVAFSPDGRRIVSGGGYVKKPGELKLWDVESGREIQALTGHTDLILCVAFSPDGQRIVSCSMDKTLKVWDAVSGKDSLTLTGHRGFVICASFSPDGRRIVSGGGSGDNMLKVWDAQSGQETLMLRGHSSLIRSVSFSPDGRQIVSGSDDDTLKVWDAVSGREMLSMKPHGGRVDCVTFSPDGKRIVSGGHDDSIKVWDVESGREELALTRCGGMVESVSFSPNGRRIVSGSRLQNGPLHVWDTESGEEIQTLSGHTSIATTAAYSPDGGRIVSGAGDSTLKVWDTRSAQETMTLRGHTGQILSVAYSQDGRRIVSGSRDKTLKVWEAQNGQEIFTLTGHTDSVESVAYSPDSRQIVSGGQDGTMKVWDAESGQPRLSFKGSSDKVWSVAFSPDGRHIASGGDDGILKLWDAKTGQNLLSVKATAAEITCVAWKPDGSQIATAHSLNGTVKVWDISKYLTAVSPKGNQQRPSSTTKVRAALKESTSVDFVILRFESAIDFLADKHDITILLDKQGLKRARVSVDRPVTLRMSRVTLEDVLKSMLGPLKLTFHIGELPIQSNSSQQKVSGEMGLIITSVEQAANGDLTGNESPNPTMTNSIGMKLVLIPSGEFLMGTPESEKNSGYTSYERPQHQVKITKPFYMSVYEVTHGDFEQVMGKRVRFERTGFGRERLPSSREYPVAAISWRQAVLFCNRLSAMESYEPYYRRKSNSATILGGNGYRLPTEAEWEYACRAGTTTSRHFDERQSKLSDFAWYKGTTRATPTTHPVGQKKPNGWGLFDMYGNVWEWCQDWYDASYYRHSPRVDPTGPKGIPSGRDPKHVVRGGDFKSEAKECRSAMHRSTWPHFHIGFRVVRNLDSQP